MSQNGPISLFVKDEYIISLAHIIAVKWIPDANRASVARVRRGNTTPEVKMPRKLEVLGAVDREFRLMVSEEIGQELVLALINYHELYYSRKPPV